MKTIVLCGKQGDNAVAQTLLPALGRYGSVCYMSETKIAGQSNVGKHKFCVLDCPQLPQIELPQVILLFKNSFSLSGRTAQLPEGIPAVFGSHNARAAEQLKGSKVAAIVCGTSAKDTLSVASLTESSASASLQRSLHTLAGDVIEPRDIPVELSGQTGPYSFLATCAVLLLAGVEPEPGYQF